MAAEIGRPSVDIFAFWSKLTKIRDGTYSFPLEEACKMLQSESPLQITLSEAQIVDSQLLKTCPAFTLMIQSISVFDDVDQDNEMEISFPSFRYNNFGMLISLLNREMDITMIQLQAAKNGPVSGHLLSNLCAFAFVDDIVYFITKGRKIRYTFSQNINGYFGSLEHNPIPIKEGIGKRKAISFPIQLDEALYFDREWRGGASMNLLMGCQFLASSVESNMPSHIFDAIFLNGVGLNDVFIHKNPPHSYSWHTFNVLNPPFLMLTFCDANRSPLDFDKQAFEESGGSTDTLFRFTLKKQLAFF